LKTITKSFSHSFGAGQSGTSVSLASFNLPTGNYIISVFSTGGGSDASISLDQASTYYQYYQGSFQPSVFALAEPDSSGIISFHITASTNNASTTTGVIVIEHVDNV
jgi:hypothetical protein